MKKSFFKLFRSRMRGLWFFFWGHVFAFLYYDKKYLKGKHFVGKMHGFNSIGWRWVTIDGFMRLLTRENITSKFPVNSNTRIVSPENIVFDNDDLNNFQSTGCYFQAIGKIKIGKGTYIAQNVGIITSNHVFSDLDEHQPPQDVVIGEKCWIGMNSVILPGVILGNNTVVGAGSIVTKSFTKGKCVIAGNPAKEIRKLDVNK